MLLRKARITKFRSIDDSSLVTIDPDVTVLVGQNESGKTAFLKALHKARAVESSVGFDVQEDYPRKDLTSYRKRHDSNPQQVVALVYQFEASDIERITKAIGVEVLPEGHEITWERSYAGGGTVNGLFPAERPYIDYRLSQTSLDIETKNRLGATLTVKSLIAGLEEADLNTDGQALLSDLKEKFGKSAWDNALSWYMWEKLIRPYIPKFLYFDDYYLLPDKVNLRSLKRKASAGTLDPEDETVLALFSMADMSLDDMLNEAGYEAVKANLEGLSNTITDQIFTFWTQNKELAVQIDVREDPSDDPPFDNGPNLYIRIHNHRHRVTVPFGQRSRGFIWFFSFLVWFDSVREKLGEENLVLLLDEPGLNLHALAQDDLLQYIDNLAGTHQVIYTTHSPFMVRGERLHQVRLVEDRLGEGTRVADDVTGSDPATVFPLQAALGYTIAQNLFISKRNLLVEGPADLVYLRFMSMQLEAHGRAGLRDDVTIVPVGGLDKLATFVALLQGNQLEMVVLHDSTGKADQRLTSVVQAKLIRDKQLLNYGMFVPTNGTAAPAADVEDLFTPAEYLVLFNGAYVKELPQKFTVASLPAGDRIVERITRHLRSEGLELKKGGGFNHYLVANHLAAHPPKKIDAKTLDRYESLFKRINTILPAYA
jgi:hypothetical protein